MKISVCRVKGNWKKKKQVLLFNPTLCTSKWSKCAFSQCKCATAGKLTRLYNFVQVGYL